jgi:predicted helicase
MWNTIKLFSLSGESEAREKFKLNKDGRDWKISWAQKDIVTQSTSKTNIKPILYRPFDIRHTYFTGTDRGFLKCPRTNVMSHMLSVTDNIALITSRNALKNFNHIFLSEILIDGHTTEGRSYLYPLYKKDGSQTKINLSEEIQQILTQTYKQPIESLARPFFNYIYAIFHAPSFRTRYAEFLKQDFPRVQITPDKKLFFQLAKLGQELIDLHLLKNEGLEEGKTQFKDEGLLKNAPRIVSKVTYDSKSQKVFINENHYFSHIDEESFQFQIGGYQVLHKWLKDRKGRELTSEDISHYIKVVESLKRTQKLMLKIDDVILKAGGWPLVREELKKAA